MYIVRTCKYRLVFNAVYYRKNEIIKRACRSIILWLFQQQQLIFLALIFKNAFKSCSYVVLTITRVSPGDPSWEPRWVRRPQVEKSYVRLQLHYILTTVALKYKLVGHNKLNSAHVLYKHSIATLKNISSFHAYSSMAY